MTCGIFRFDLSEPSPDPLGSSTPFLVSTYRMLSATDLGDGSAGTTSTADRSAQPRSGPELAPMRPRVIAVANQKGGVGKTTTTVNLSAALALAGQRVLLLDLDPQANSSSGLGINGDSYPSTVYESLIGLEELHSARLKTEIEHLDLIPSSRRLVGAELELADVERREFRLKESLASIEREYDLVLIDCPPSLGLLTLNALTAARSILIPIQCEYYALEGLGSLMHTIRLVQGRLNPSLFVEGVLLTMFDGRLNLAQQVADETRRYFGDRVYRSIIPRNVKVSEAPSFGKPVMIYDPRSAGSLSFETLAKEVLGDEQESLGPRTGRPDSGRDDGDTSGWIPDHSSSA